MSRKPEIKSDPMYMLLREEQIDEFNKRKAQGESFDLTNCDLRALDLRRIEAEGIDFSDSYFRLADLRGVNWSNSRLEGSSIHGAKISGCYFPKELSAEEIQLSLTKGTRMRYIRPDEKQQIKSGLDFAF